MMPYIVNLKDYLRYYLLIFYKIDLETIITYIYIECQYPF